MESKIERVRTLTWVASRLSSATDWPTPAALIVSPPSSWRNFPQNSTFSVVKYSLMIVRVVSYRVANAAMIFEQRPFGTTGCCWRG
jgi:hypothetical protein